VLLTVVWDELLQANVPDKVRLRSNSSGGWSVPTNYGLWDGPGTNGYLNNNLSNLSLGVGDGGTSCVGFPNFGYLYLV
jgi:hypothetical protein